MSSHDEELQRKVERGELSDVGSADSRAYHKVFSALGKEVGYELPPRFADQVVARLQRQQSRKYARDYFWFAAGILIMLGAFAATVILTGLKLDLGFLSPMSGYKGLVLFAASFIMLLHWLDKRLIRKHSHG